MHDAEYDGKRQCLVSTESWPKNDSNDPFAYAETRGRNETDKTSQIASRKCTGNQQWRRWPPSCSAIHEECKAGRDYRPTANTHHQHEQDAERRRERRATHE